MYKRQRHGRGDAGGLRAGSRGGADYEEGATMRQRNAQIGGHPFRSKVRFLPDTPSYDFFSVTERIYVFLQIFVAIEIFIVNACS